VYIIYYVKLISEGKIYNGRLLISQLLINVEVLPHLARVKYCRHKGLMERHGRKAKALET
jgi:hypothetical protein